MKQATATRVAKTYPHATGEMRLYRLEPPMRATKYDGNGEEIDVYHDLVVVSAVVAHGTGPETYLFPAGLDGEIEDFLELEGSFRGSLDHHEALRGAGYHDVVEEPIALDQAVAALEEA